MKVSNTHIYIYVTFLYSFIIDLKFLADRLLGNAYHSWVRTIVRNTHSAGYQNKAPVKGIGTNEGENELLYFLNQQRPLQRLLFSATMTDNPRKLALLNIFNPQVVRVGQQEQMEEGREEGLTNSVVDDVDDGEMVSQGMPDMKEEGKKDLRSPHEAKAERNANTEVIAQSEYNLPSTLIEYKCVTETSKRPLLLLSILFEATGIISNGLYDFSFPEQSSNMCIIFSSSLASTHRLCRLLQLVNRQHEVESDISSSSYTFGGKVCEMSRAVDKQNRQRVMSEAAEGKVRLLIATDHMSRGIDLPNVTLVINYDPPRQAKTYVHRVGRTARANRQGWAITMLKNGQTKEFKKMRGSISGKDKVGSLSMIAAGEQVLGAYKAALSLLPKVVALEEEGTLKHYGDLYGLL